MSNIINIYLNENSSMFDLLDLLGNDSTKLSNSLRSSLQKIIINYNNLVGYAKFKIGENRYNLYIFPKFINISNNPSLQQKKQYIYYLIDYFNLKKIYAELKEKETSLKFSFQSPNAEPGFGDFFDTLLNMQYETALDEALNYIKKFKIIQQNDTKFHSQSISNRIDLSANMFEVNKTKIHQIDDKESNHAIKIDYILSAINKFIEKNRDNEVLIKKALNIKRIILGKFVCVKVASQDIVRNKVSTIFNNDKNIYKCILILIGKETLFCDMLQSDNGFIEDIKFIFFKPADVFEFFVMDYLKTQYAAKFVEYHEVFQYTIKNIGFKAKKIPAIPDFLITTTKNADTIDYIYDAKWKILKNSDFPETEDLVKLHKDCEVIKNDYKRNILKCGLIYPQIIDSHNRLLSISFIDGFEPEVIYIKVLRPIESL